MLAIVFVVIVVLVLLGGVAMLYNGLVRRRNRVAEAWSQIAVELRRRHDLIPNLVEAVRGYAGHEQSTFDQVAAARSAAVTAGAAGDPRQVALAESALSASLRSLFAVAESYPTLRAVESFLQLQEQLTATEDKLEYARRFYNGCVLAYNTAVQSFPRNLVAAAGGFRPRDFFEPATTDEAVPEVSFGSTPIGLPQAGPTATAATTNPAPQGSTRPGG
ncbi:MAG TPA: LemA family protein [Jatrophihabitans sp.]|nr:LemA family protein [Jatrophihabitans sp.]